ncbi:hypothetical protein [Stappia sp.]|uniref:hypothetical protein n=1 Tax=Stappia sp. TaxID=1870903 RepID=UPI0032D95F6E
MRGWRTLTLNALAAGAALALEVSRFLVGVDWAAHLPPATALWMLVLVNVANIALRHVTDRPAGWRKSGR